MSAPTGLTELRGIRYSRYFDPAVVNTAFQGVAPMPDITPDNMAFIDCRHFYLPGWETWHATARAGNGETAP